MANTLLSSNQHKRFIGKDPEWHVFDAQIDASGSIVLRDDIPEGVVFDDSFLNVYQAEAGATSLKADIDYYDGSTAVVINTGAADNLGATGKKAGTVVPKVPLPDNPATSGDPYSLRLTATISGTASTAAKALVYVLMHRPSY